MKKILELIKKENFEEADILLDKLIKDENNELKRTRYYYLSACINYDYKNAKRNLKKAKRYIKYCINSDYVEESYYNLYKKLEDDKVIFEAVIRNAVLKFPKSIDLNTMLFDLESLKGKLELLEKIKGTEILTEKFIMMYLSYFFIEKEWDKICYLNDYIEVDSFDKNNLLFINLIMAIGFMFKENSDNNDFKKVELILNNIIKEDMNNQLENNSYIILLYCYYLLNDSKSFNEIVNKLPVSCKYNDLINYPYPIEINFESLYKYIFPKLISFSKDKQIKRKISAIYSLYLFSDYKNNFEIRFTKQHASYIRHLAKLNI